MSWYVSITKRPMLLEFKGFACKHEEAYLGTQLAGQADRTQSRDLCVETNAAILLPGNKYMIDHGGPSEDGEVPLLCNGTNCDEFPF